MAQWPEKMQPKTTKDPNPLALLYPYFATANEEEKMIN